jgi:hypothetical protein
MMRARMEQVNQNWPLYLMQNGHNPYGEDPTYIVYGYIFGLDNMGNINQLIQTTSQFSTILEHLAALKSNDACRLVDNRMNYTAYITTITTTDRLGLLSHVRGPNPGGRYTYQPRGAARTNPQDRRNEIGKIQAACNRPRLVNRNLQQRTEHNGHSVMRDLTVNANAPLNNQHRVNGIPALSNERNMNNWEEVYLTRDNNPQGGNQGLNIFTGLNQIMRNNDTQAELNTRAEVRSKQTFVIDNTNRVSSSDSDRLKIFLNGTEIQDNEAAAVPEIYGTPFILVYGTLLSVLRKTCILRSDTQPTIDNMLEPVQHRLRYAALRTFGQNIHYKMNSSFVLLRSLTPYHIPTFRMDQSDGNNLHRVQAVVNAARLEHQHIYPNQNVEVTRDYEQLGYVMRTGCTTLEDASLVYGESPAPTEVGTRKHWDLQIWSSYTMRIREEGKNNYNDYILISVNAIKEMINQFKVDMFPDENALLYT